MTIERYNSIINGDCLEELDMLDDDIADLIILDPPYDKWDKFLENGIICQSVRLLKPSGNLICFTKQPFDFNLRCDIDHMFRREIVWTFTNGGAWVSKKMPLVSHQKIYWCTPTKDFYFNERTGLQYSEKTKDFERSKKVFEGYESKGRKFTKDENGVWLRDHLHFNKPNMGKIPAKPLELIEILIRCFCPKGGLVLDPFMGSGTTAIVAKNYGCNYLGIELNHDYIEIANKRIELETSQPTLF
jgi:site-specific DNA-methyltransferase (adenine-specific)